MEKIDKISTVTVSRRHLTHRAVPYLPHDVSEKKALPHSNGTKNTRPPLSSPHSSGCDISPGRTGHRTSFPPQIHVSETLKWFPLSAPTHRVEVLLQV